MDESPNPNDPVSTDGLDDVAMALADDLFKHLSEGRTEQAEKARATNTPFDRDDEKMWADSAIAKYLSTRQAEAFANEAPFTDTQLEAAKEEAYDRSFSNGRAMRWWDSEVQAINAWIIGGQPVRIQYGNGRVSMGPPVAKDSADLERQVNRLISVGGVVDAEWDATRHEVGFVMPDGTRVTAIHEVGDEVFLTMRRPTMLQATLQTLLDNGTLTPMQASFVEAIPKANLQMFVGGQTNAGKTTLMRTVIGAQPSDWIVFTVETEPELLLERFPDLYPMTFSMRGVKETTQGNFSRPLGDLVRSCQRASADLVVVGEIRDGSEAGAALLALNQGYAVMGTIHSKSAHDAVSNLARYFSEGTGAPLDAAMQRAARGVDFVVQMQRLPSGQPVIGEIGFVELNGEGSMTVTPIWEPAADRTAQLTSLAKLPAPILEALVRAGFDETLSDEPQPRVHSGGEARV